MEQHLNDDLNNNLHQDLHSDLHQDLNLNDVCVRCLIRFAYDEVLKSQASDEEK